ncbi:unnamed protein product [Phytomonas sp. Hart1]|nr:unnamed protein product [Phytomonas sp. Hart1]|eukprot:CCW69264.1 unnamed protein product [Phytomonas sp. isolate Hart1]
MTLVVTNEVEQEAKRILAAGSSYEVLEINPRDFDKELVLKNYGVKVNIFKRLFRNKLAMQAKVRLDDAKMRLLDERFRVKEDEAYINVERGKKKEEETIYALEARTMLLEVRAAGILQAQNQ